MAPMPAASVVVKKPLYMPPSTNMNSRATGQMLLQGAEALAPLKRSPRGIQSGRQMPTICTVIEYMTIAIRPGMMPAKNSLAMSVSVMMP